MSVLKIVEWPSRALETKAEEVVVFDDSLKNLVNSMHETMKSARGIGLAANQVDVLKRVVTINIPWVESCELDPEKKTWHNKALTFVNPVITKHSHEKISSQEGCLSFPSLFDFISRYETVTVQAFDAEGKPFVIEADGLLSICLQHEIDHLDGIIFIKRMSRLKARLAKNKLLKRRAMTS